MGIINVGWLSNSLSALALFLLISCAPLTHNEAIQRDLSSQYERGEISKEEYDTQVRRNREAEPLRGNQLTPGGGWSPNDPSKSPTSYR